MLHGMDYDEYVKLMQTRAAGAGEQPDNERMQAIPMNLHRSQRISKTYQVPEDICRLINQIAAKQYWLVLTEPWCGDSSQTLPFIAHYANCSPDIELRILLRDQYPEIMDCYLTDGNRGIPKLVVFSEEGVELLQWGPRPEAARQLFNRNKAAGMQKKENIAQVMLWYGRDRGHTLEAEFRTILENLIEKNVEVSGDR
jgi:hypothetical protein